MMLELLCALLSVSVTVQETEPESPALSQLAIGHWVEIKGELLASGVFEAEEIKVTEPDEEEALLGTVGEHDVSRNELWLLGQRIRISEKTTWTDLNPHDLTDQRVLISGHYRGPDKFSARDIRMRPEGRARIAGRVDDLRESEQGLELEVMSFLVHVPTTAKLSADGSVSALQQIPKRWTPPQMSGRVDEDDLLRENFQIAPWLRFGGQVEINSDYEDDFDLDSVDKADRWDTEAALRLRLAWRLADDVFARTEVVGSYRWRDDQEDGYSIADRIRPGENWVYWRNLLGDTVDLQVGRQDFDDSREWIYDKDLDGVRLISTGDTLRAQYFAATILGGAASQRDQGSINVGAYLSNLDDDQQLAAWFLHRDFEQGNDGRLTHVGLRAIGDWWSPADTWLDLGAVAGEEDGRDVFGWGGDLGATVRARNSSLAWSLGLAYASGDDGSGTDSAYRQSGLQDNNAKLGTATSIRYYGELLEPELSNMRILTAGVSWWFEERSSLALIYHDYLQVEASDSIRDSNLDMDPNGIGRDLGSELDLVLSSRAFESVDLEFVAGGFFPGNAFDTNEDALFLRLQMRYRF